MGLLRWIPNGSFYYIFAIPDTTTDSGLTQCFITALVDNVLQVATMFTNTTIVLSVFTQVYTAQRISKEEYEHRDKIFLILFGVCISIFGVFSGLFGQVDESQLGWCTLDNVGLVGKHIFYYLCILLQLTMLIPTMVILCISGKKSGNNLGIGTYLRFFGILLSQTIGFVPLFIEDTYIV